MDVPAGATPKGGDTVTSARSGDFNHFDPYFTGAVQWPMGHNIYSSLVYYDEALNLYGGLAEKWELRDGNKTLNVQLWKGVKFHNGREFTADDVVFNVERMMDKSIGHATFPQTVAMEGAKAVDK